jgi:NADH:ubiquinone oxidoreductase subunit K
MYVEFYLVLSAALVGIGLGSALYRRNLIAITMSIVTAGAGAVVAMTVLDQGAKGKTDGLLFALSLGSMLIIVFVLGCALAYRRYMATGITNVSDGNELRH